MEYPIKEKWLGNKDIVAELQDFKVKLSNEKNIERVNTIYN